MSETYIPTPTPEKSEQPEQIKDNFDVINEWQAEDAARRAKESFIDSPALAAEPVETDYATSTTEPVESKIWSTSMKVATGVAAGVALTVGAGLVVKATSAPEFSDTTTEYTVQSGDGLYDAAEAIKGSDSINLNDAVDHISADPANITALQDGLQPGETIVIPVEVKQ